MKEPNDFGCRYIRAKCLGAPKSMSGCSQINVWVLPILDILHEILADASRTLQSPENGMHARWTLLAHSLRGLKPLA